MNPQDGLLNEPSIETNSIDAIQAPEPTPAPPAPEVEQPTADPKVIETLETVTAAMQQIAARQDTIEQYFKPAESEPAAPESFKPNSWDDIPAKAAEVARQVLEEEKAAIQAEENERAERDRQLEEYLTNQENELVKAGHLPAMSDENNPDDPGRKARAELFGIAHFISSTEIKNVDEVRRALNEAGLHFDPRVRQFIRSNPSMPGADVPVRSTTAATNAGPSRRPTAEELRKGDMDFIIAKYGPQYGFNV